jgi:hypothetical protein
MLFIWIKVDVQKKRGGNILKKKKGSNIGACPQAPVEYLYDPHKF